MTHALKINGQKIKAFALAMIAAVAIGGLVADCSGDQGMYQGPNDSAPKWR